MRTALTLLALLAAMSCSMAPSSGALAAGSELDELLRGPEACRLSVPNSTPLDVVVVDQDQAVSACPDPSVIVEAKSGCCSHHGGVCGCDSNTGHQLCCDGKDSPSCGC